MIFFKSIEKYLILCTTHTILTVQHEKLALIWNSMYVINMSPAPHFQETNQ